MARKFKPSLPPAKRSESSHQAAPAAEGEGTPMQALSELCESGRLIRTGRGFRMAQSVTPARNVTAQEDLVVLLMDFARQAGLVPFRGTAYKTFSGRGYPVWKVQKVLDCLHQKGKLVKLTTGRYLTPHALDRIKDGVRRVVCEQGSCTLEDAKHLLQTGRTASVEVLDYLDEIGFTRREGEKRILNV